MKTNTLICVAFALGSILLLSCRRERSPAVPESDSELQTSIDASYATFLVSDIEMICSVAGEGGMNESDPAFYAGVSPATGETHIVRDPHTSRISINFNNTLCKDGRVRDGSIFMFFKEQDYTPITLTNNENYIRDYNFVGRITLEEYKVDGWLIDNKDFENSNNGTNNVNAFLKNLRPNSQSPVLGNLQWTFEGDFTMRKNNDSMAWKGKLVKTLLNTGDANVFHPNSQTPINWSLSRISYKGSAHGITPGNVPYTYEINENTPLKRDFSCFPDKVASVPSTNSGNTLEYSESHPFTSGLVTFNTGQAYPRLIYYANEQNTFGGSGNPDIELATQCDNKATVQIKGIYYPIDLKK